jgi:hypothetical protein
MPELYPYQNHIVNTICNSVDENKGYTFSVEIARQGGKNEISAQLERFLLIGFARKAPQNLIKCSPTFKPQTVISMSRLQDRLNEQFADEWTTELGYVIRMGNARAIFLSAEESSSVVGHTAQILLEIDESQDVSKEKYTKEFKPMGAVNNVTTVHYGTAWDDTTLLEEVKQTNLELERKDGVRRHFRYDWQEVARYNPSYLAYVEGERARLGDNHPLFLTQYCLVPVRGNSSFISSQQRAQLQGEHKRQSQPSPGKIYVAGIDLAGEAEEEEGALLRTVKPRQDSTVVTIGELNSAHNLLDDSPSVRVIEHYRWAGRKHSDLYSQLVDILKNVWRCKRILVDATGIGQPVASFLKETLGSAIVPFVFSQPSKSELGFKLLAAIDSGRLKMYAADGSAEYLEFWHEMERAKSHYRPSRTMNFYVDHSHGHDDFLMSLALLVEAANRYSPRSAKGR